MLRELAFPRKQSGRRSGLAIDTPSTVRAAPRSRLHKLLSGTQPALTWSE